jgi:hypothetical protein
MAKGKQKSSSSPPFAKGGSTGMFGKQTAGTKTPGNTAGKSGGGGNFAKGGGGKMFGPQKASPKTAGTTGKP